MLAAAGEGESPADPVAAGHPYRLSGWRSRCRGSQLEIGVHGPRNVLIQEGGDISAIAVDHGAPGNRPVGHRQCFENAKLGERVKFRSTPSAWHGHSENASFLERYHNRRRQPARLLYFFGRCAYLRGKRYRRVQNGMIVGFSVACGMCHG
jgi:hypothetical protein